MRNQDSIESVKTIHYISRAHLKVLEGELFWRVRGLTRYIIVNSINGLGSIAEAAYHSRVGRQVRSLFRHKVQATSYPNQAHPQLASSSCSSQEHRPPVHDQDLHPLPMDSTQHPIKGRDSPMEEVALPLRASCRLSPLQEAVQSLGGTFRLRETCFHANAALHRHSRTGGGD